MRLNVILDNQSTAWLEEQALMIRRTSGAALSRSELLRGMLNGLMQAGTDFSCCRSAGDVASVLAFFLQARKRG